MCIDIAECTDTVLGALNIHHTTRRHFPECSNVRIHLRKSVKSFSYSKYMNCAVLMAVASLWRFADQLIRKTLAATDLSLLIMWV